MATTNTVQDHHILQFTKNVELLLQQKTPRLAGTVSTAGYQGEKAQVIKQFGEVEFVPFNAGTAAGQWKGDTQFADIAHYQRWVFPSDFSLALADAKGDDIRMLGDPRSSYAEAMRAAYARLYDDIIIAAATNPCKVGKYDDLQDQALPDDQIIDHDFDPAPGLSVAKLLEAKKRLIAAGNDPGEERYFACSESQLNDLLKTQEVTSADYNTIKALVKGEVDSFVGFKFISTERLLYSEPEGVVRHCLAWVKSGLHLGTWNGLETHVDQRADKNYLWQIWMSCTLGATRTQEKKLVQINCAE
jgi:hypothetical protein